MEESWVATGSSLILIECMQDFGWCMYVFKIKKSCELLNKLSVQYMLMSNNPLVVEGLFMCI